MATSGLLDVGNRVYGTYAPSEYRIDLVGRWPRPGDVRPRVRPAGSTLLHEYLHFVSDVSTTSGWLLALYKLAALGWAPLVYEQAGLAAIDPSLTAERENMRFEWRKGLRQTVSALEGTPDRMDIDRETLAAAARDGLLLCEKQEMRIKEETATIEAPILRMSDGAEVMIGTRVLFEGLARRLQLNLERHGIALPRPSGVRAEDAHPPYPYQLSELLAAPFGCESPAHVAVLSDQALLDSSPGRRFVRLLEEYRTRAWSHSTPEQLVAACKSVGPAGVAEEAVDRILAQFLDQNSEVPRKAFRWVRQVVDVVRATRAEDPLFFVRPVFSERPDDALNEIIRLLPSPIIQEWPEDSAPAPPELLGVHDRWEADRDVVFFFSSVQRLLLEADRAAPGAQVECPFAGGCYHEFRDAGCRTTPWAKVARRLTCQMGAAAKFVGIRPVATSEAAAE